MAARADQLCDAAKAVIEAAAVANTISGTTVTVTCDDDPDIDGDDLAAGQMYVLVWWEAYADGGGVTRGQQATDYRLCFLVVEKYGAAGNVTTAWRRVRSEWVDTCVVKALGDARDQLDGAYALSLEEVLFDQDELIERQLFWTRVTVVFRDEEDV